MDSRISICDEKPGRSIDLYREFISVFQSRNSNAVPPTYFEFYNGYRSNSGGDDFHDRIDRCNCLPPLLEGLKSCSQEGTADGSCDAIGGDQSVPVVGNVPGDDRLPDVVRPRGKHYKKNLARRRKRVEVGRALEKVDDSNNASGFWAMCSPDKRQSLIDSKADMHIAENERRARIARDAVKKMDSPEAMVRKAMAIIKLAENCAKKEENSGVAGWAATVASSYAESIARSAPSTVPSYASVVSGASSVSVDGSKRDKRSEAYLQVKSEIDVVTCYRDAVAVQSLIADAKELTGDERCELNDIVHELMEIFFQAGRM